jgi:hypothetical protein
MRYAAWQAKYAEQGIPTFPIDENKKPLVSNYEKVGIRGATTIARKFADAPGLGFMAGERARITVVDVDEKGEAPLIAALDRFGPTPLIERTASDKYHLYYRHNGELRSVRPERGVEIDILGAGVIIAPWTERESRRAEFISGSLDDIANLPIARNIPSAAKLVIVPDDFAPQIVPDDDPPPLTAPKGRRNKELWEHCMRQAKTCEGFNDLLLRARNVNAGLAEPLGDEEVVEVTGKAWGYQVAGLNRFGDGPGVWLTAPQVNDLFGRLSGDAILLLLFLKANHQRNNTFMIANGIADRVGLSRERLQAARKSLLEHGMIRCVRWAANNKPAQFRWLSQPPGTPGLGEAGAAGGGVIENR